MNDSYFAIQRKGLHGELAYLPIGDILPHLRNHQANFLLDKAVTACYLSRFLAEPASTAPSWVRPTADYLIGKVLRFSPFDIMGIRTPPVMADPAARTKIEILEKTNAEPRTLDKINALSLKSDARDIAEFLRKLLLAYPHYALAASSLLDAEYHLGAARPDWLGRFKCPRPLKDDFNLMLFHHYAAMGADAEAKAVWSSLPEALIGEVSLNLAAEIARRDGDLPRALNLYVRSLALDPSQDPVRRRLGELRRPSRKLPELTAAKKVAIYLYSFNKAGMLKRTLESLAASDIGPASVTVLLNGCTDDSLAVVESARALFPDNPFEIIPLHVNIGAPAARDWLINLPRTWETDYVAFLDDDVDVPADWLQWYLTVAETDPKVAVVGGKIVFPGQPAQIQYLFRYVSVAQNDLLRVSLDAPNSQYDQGHYDFIRETRSVMGCLHLLRTEALRQVPNFDIRFSPSQVDDIDHDLCLCLKGYKVMYCGLVTCVHHQSSGVGQQSNPADIMRTGNCLGNDIKLFYKHFLNLGELRKLDNLSLLPPHAVPGGDRPL